VHGRSSTEPGSDRRDVVKLADTFGAFGAFMDGLTPLSVAAHA
jgi:hypothetical protein